MARGYFFLNLLILSFASGISILLSAMICGFFAKLLRVLGKLVVQCLVIIDRIPAFECGDIDKVYQDFRALYVAQEPVAEPFTLMGALDKPRYLGHDEMGILVRFYDAENGRYRRKGIVGDLRMRARYLRDEGRFPGVRVTDDTGVGDQLELEKDRPLFPGRAAASRRGRGNCRARLRRPSPRCRYPRPDEVPHDKTVDGVLQDRPGRDFHELVRPAVAFFVIGTAVQIRSAP